RLVVEDLLSRPGRRDLSQLRYPVPVVVDADIVLRDLDELHRAVDVRRLLVVVVYRSPRFLLGARDLSPRGEIVDHRPRIALGYQLGAGALDPVGAIPRVLNRTRVLRKEELLRGNGHHPYTPVG